MNLVGTFKREENDTKVIVIAEQIIKDKKTYNLKIVGKILNEVREDFPKLYDEDIEIETKNGNLEISFCVTQKKMPDYLEEEK